ncbi:protein TBRG4 [Eurytemora carolleeae]|uniref:protein TBRG4 n=1 Tax=Eurytemora carolleeae TaxID=1294199 RepID=UPI000C755AFD|nr:protein TBRG4 [Eurytemora carolleeae]|eukprot:XP_023328867.1 protein TBRG4-like [Eurytemora affinis]
MVFLSSEVCTVLERRWVELTDPRILSLLLLHADKLTPQLVNRLEDRVQDTAEDMVVCDIVNILTSLGKTGRRNMPVLRSLGFHLAKKRSFLDIKQIADILFAFNRVSFKEQDTLERILSSLEPLLSTNNKTAVVRSILTSLGQLKLSNPPVLDAVCDWFDKRLSETRGVEPRDISTLLLTLANLNYTPPEREQFLKKCSSLVKREDFLSLPRGEQIWVDIVWSLVNLNIATSEQISSVLENKFFTKIIESDDKYTSLKLLNINAAAQLLNKDYKGASINLTENGHLSEISLSPSVQKTKLKKFMFETLSTLFPPPRFISEDVKTGLGFTMDAEIIVDSFAKPLQIEQYSVLPGTNKPPKELPKGATKVALFINPFQESLIGGGLTGTTNLNVRLAEAKGYRALVLDYRTIDASMKTISRVQKIDALVKQTISKQNQS